MPSTPTTGVGSMSRPARLVVEADVAAHHRQAEGAARLGHPVDGLRELPHHLGVLRVAEVQAVDERERPRPDAGQVEHRLGHHPRRAGPRVDRAPPVVAVGGQGQRPAGVLAGDGVLEAQHGGVAAGPDDGVEEELVVVLRATPRPCRPACPSRSAPRVGRRRVERAPDRARRDRSAGPQGPVVERRGVVERRRRHVGERPRRRPSRMRRRAAVGTRPTTVARTSQRRHRWRAPRRGRRARRWPASAPGSPTS